MKDKLQSLDKEQNVLNQDNEALRDQNSKLKEEMTTLITSFHSLKDSHLMLQVSYFCCSCQKGFFAMFR